MGDPHHGGAPVFPETLDTADDEAAAAGVEVGGGFIEQQHLGGTGKEPQQREARPLTGGEPRRVGVPNPRIEPERSKFPWQGRAPGRKVPRHRRTPKARLGGQERDAPPPFRRGHGLRLPTRPPDLASMRIEVGEGAQKPRFPGPGRTGDRQRPRRRHLEGKRRQTRHQQIPGREHTAILPPRTSAEYFRPQGPSPPASATRTGSRPTRLPYTRAMKGAEGETTAPAAALPRFAVAGVLGGLASLVPGVSGGTMILAAGVYPQLVGAVAEIASGRFRPASLIRLGTTVAFALVAIVAVAGAARDAFTAWPVAFFSLFLGLTLGGAPLLWRMAEARGRAFGLGAAAGAMAVVLPLLLTAPSGADSGAFGAGAPALFGAGAVAAFAMVLPGISGSTLLLLMGMYLPFLDAVAGVREALGLRPWSFGAVADSVAGVLPFALGILVGIAVSARLVRYFLGAYRQATLGTLFGLLLGASAGLWPFQTVNGARFAPDGAQIAVAAGALAVGFLFTLFLGSRRRKDG